MILRKNKSNGVDGRGNVISNIVIISNINNAKDYYYYRCYPVFIVGGVCWETGGELVTHERGKGKIFRCKLFLDQFLTFYFKDTNTSWG